MIFFHRSFVQINGTLVITNILPGDAGNYICIATNDYGQANVTVTLTVLVPPKLSYQSTSVPPLLGYGYTLSVHVLTTPIPALDFSDIKWKKINGTQTGTIIYDIVPGVIQLSFINITVKISGQYELSVNTVAGNDTVNLTIDVQGKLLTFIKIISFLLAYPIAITSRQTIVVKEGGSVMFVCVGDGLPPPSFAWFVNRRQLGVRVPYTNTIYIIPII